MVNYFCNTSNVSPFKCKMQLIFLPVFPLIRHFFRYLVLPHNILDDLNKDKFHFLTII